MEVAPITDEEAAGGIRQTTMTALMTAYLYEADARAANSLRLNYLAAYGDIYSDGGRIWDNCPSTDDPPVDNSVRQALTVDILGVMDEIPPLLTEDPAATEDEDRFSRLATTLTDIRSRYLIPGTTDHLPAETMAIVEDDSLGAAAIEAVQSNREAMRRVHTAFMGLVAVGLYELVQWEDDSILRPALTAIEAYNHGIYNLDPHQTGIGWARQILLRARGAIEADRTIIRRHKWDDGVVLAKAGHCLTRIQEITYARGLYALGVLSVVDVHAINGSMDFIPGKTPMPPNYERDYVDRYAGTHPTDPIIPPTGSDRTH
jgi:hypothetical protein